jgi:hypothetical protein
VNRRSWLPLNLKDFTGCSSMTVGVQGSRDVVGSICRMECDHDSEKSPDTDAGRAV